MAEVDELARVFLSQGADALALPAHLARVGRQQATQDAQQAGLAAAVRACDAQRLPGAEREAQAREELLLLSHAFQPRRFEHSPYSCRNAAPGLTEVKPGADPP